MTVDTWGAADAPAAPQARAVVLAQIRSISRDRAANRRRIVQMLEEHPTVDIVVFPELFLTGYELERLGELAITTSDIELDAIAEACKRTSTAVIFGFVELDGSKILNSMAAIDSDGRLQGVYRKMNLFGAEAEAFSPGDGYVDVELTGIRVGLLNCFDIEFPEPARELALKGAQLLISIAANMEPYFSDHELASRARALDNRLPHVYVNAVGKSAGFTFVGGSRYVDQNGAVETSAGASESVDVAHVAIGQAIDPAVDYLRHLRSRPALPM